MSCVEPSDRELNYKWGHQSHILSHWTLTALTDLMWSLRDKLIHWDSAINIVSFPESPMLYIKHPVMLLLLWIVFIMVKACSSNLKEDRIHCEYIKAAKHFEYKEWCKTILSKRIWCPWQCSCEHCKLRKNRTIKGYWNPVPLWAIEEPWPSRGMEL